MAYCPGTPTPREREVLGYNFTDMGCGIVVSLCSCHKPAKEVHVSLSYFKICQ